MLHTHLCVMGDPCWKMNIHNKMKQMKRGHAQSNQNGIGTLESGSSTRIFDKLQATIQNIINARANASSDIAVCQFSNDYYKLDQSNKHRILTLLATKYGVNRTNIQNLSQQYSDLCKAEKETKEEKNTPALYRTEHSLRSALTPLSVQLFKQINCQPGGLKFLVDMRADLRMLIEDQNLPAFRYLDTCLKEILETALSPALLELHLFTWEDPAAILEKLVIFEAVHPISNLYDLKRRLGSERRCFGYFHPSLPGEPLIFIEVALTRSIVGCIQDVLRNESPTPEDEATTALFYSISSTQPGLTGISLGKLLIKRVVGVLQQEMPKIMTFATLSPIPGFMSWLLPRLASESQSFSSSRMQQDSERKSLFKENLLHAQEARSLLESCRTAENQTAENIMWNILTFPRKELIRSESLQGVIKPILLRLCARYLLLEKRRGKALDVVTNFHVQNGALIERLNWMGDFSERGLNQSAGITVNYCYRLDKIEENIGNYLEKGIISSSSMLKDLLEPKSMSPG
ncbi:hypothetical protein KP509_11G060400 [Ceratopteris richardii]|uniref:Malonyl-CoA decarboxylase n=1 Tax=Ceratopteris richardii TaxID=49495 RepID=A0A8T2TVC4_CERRI|nr:hypothetical protein KP509_11G060400 [Ceratopteris richardii]